ncbi:helix-turn-helix domain-containing protein [Actinokineospora pegani]|uniref:helix-turn-helix domain-containing protein n=1 Tax=Actinokineospora pegani TaxID=2654637 RepID=UPI0012EAB457|nr:helix-turn-helix domain-containing protein [Actinokineospora pegani]
MSEVDGGASRFGRLLHGHRARVGLTQRELADLSTVSVRAIRDLEQGRARKPRQDTVRLVSDALRLGVQARGELERAAHQGRAGVTVGADYPVEMAPAPVVDGVLVGREREVASLMGELESARLVTVVGLRGVGKTRLVAEVAGRLHGDGVPVLWVGGECPMRDEVLAGVVAAGVAGLGRGGDGQALGELVEVIAGRRTLLVVDDPGVAFDEERVRGLMRECPGLRVLVTSPAPVEVAGERLFLLSPLSDAEAVELFEHCARGERVLTEADRSVVTEICRLVDGVPAAVIAAASWLAVYGVEMLQTALRDDLLGHVEGVLNPSGVREGVSRCVRELPDPRLLGRLPAEFTLDDVVAVSGLSLPECGRVVRGLLLRGVVRAREVDGFRVLGLVRVVLGQVVDLVVVAV